MPTSGPSDLAIQGAATSTLSTKDVKAAKTEYVLLDINEAILPYFRDTHLSSFAPGFKNFRQTAPSIPVGIGDTVKVTIFESSAGGLFIPGEGNLSQGNYVELPEQKIDSSGTITVPYVGRVRAAGYSTGAIERAIVKALQNRAIEPQVMVTVTDAQSSLITIMGDGGNTRTAVNPNGERLLDVLARTGGISGPAEETYITLKRGGKESRVLFKNVIKNDAENIFIIPGDTLYIDRERRTFIAFGAMGAIGRVDFNESDLSLVEAVGEVGGLLDDVSDAEKVFLYRLVDRETLLKAGTDLSHIQAKMVPTVFRMNMRDPAALFQARKFAMQDKDVVYVSKAKTYEITKFLSIINGITGGVSTGISNVNGIKTNWETLKD